MSLLEEINTLISPIVPIETGLFSDTPLDEYLIITPLVDTFELHGDNSPGYEVQEARLSLFTKGNYMQLKNIIVRTLLSADFNITDRRYIGYEEDTGFHHNAIDVAKSYKLEV